MPIVAHHVIGHAVTDLVAAALNMIWETAADNPVMESGKSLCD